MIKKFNILKKYSNTPNFIISNIKMFREYRHHKMSKAEFSFCSLIFTILQKKAKLTGYVVAAGLQYGKGENLFHFFFKVDINLINVTQYFFLYFLLQ